MRVAFSPIGDATWTGGVSYLRNLLQVLASHSKGTIEPVLVSGTGRPAAFGSLLPEKIEIIAVRCLDKWSPAWSIRQVARRVLDRDLWMEQVLKRSGIDAVFHAGLFGSRFRLPCVNWIADFQHLHMPEMFERSELRFRNRHFRDIARMSDVVVVSSNSAKHDLEGFLPEFRDRVAVMPFAVLVPPAVYRMDPVRPLSEYGLPDRFFHLPNQFWKHKNHEVVLEAVRILKERGHNVTVVCTGSMQDRRNAGHVDSLRVAIAAGGLGAQVRLLGLVPLDHLYALMRRSVAIINPSFFEGWSTTVEEARSLGKQVILSDIPVHREQSPPHAAYFDPRDPSGLADRMLALWETVPPGPQNELESQARTSSAERLESFVQSFISIMNRAIRLKGAIA